MKAKSKAKGCQRHKTKDADGRLVILRKRDCPGCLREQVLSYMSRQGVAIEVIDQLGAMAHEARKNLEWLVNYTRITDTASKRLSEPLKARGEGRVSG
jgi:hypothetical protein